MRQTLFRKYALVFVVLVSGTLLTSGALQTVFAFQENQAALVAVQREKAIAAAARIQAFVEDVERQMAGAVPPPLLAVGPVSPEARRDELLRLQRQVSAVMEVSYLDGNGREQVRISRIATTALASGADRSSEPIFVEARRGQTAFGNVYFRNQSEPYISIGVPEPAPGTGVTIAEVNLKLIWDVVSRIRVGDAGYAYVVDQGGQLVAHPDLSLVLQRADLSGLSQVQAARGAQPNPRTEPTIARDLAGRQVLTARAVIDRPNWSVFVEQPLEEAFAPLYALLARIGLTLLGGLLLSILASLVLARRMTQPIRQLQARAAEIGSGQLDQRIDVRTGDELEALGEAFNSMTAQLSESYATLEQKVDERTRDLAEAMERLRALGAVSEAVSSTLDLQEVLNTVLSQAVQLSDAEAGAIYEYDEAAQEFRLRATHGMDRERLEAFTSSRAALGESSNGRAVVPLLREDRIVGSLVVHRTSPGPFDQDTLELLQTFARQSVLAIQNARLFQELEQKSQQLEDASRHKSEFLANMSHELRTPLNAINGFSQVLVERLFGEINPKQEEYLQDILSSGRHLLSVINDILDLSKVEAGRMTLEPSEFPLAEALENGLTMVRERAARRSISLTLDLDPNLGEIEADERKVKQVIFNLLSNAVKFTSDHGRVDVVARRFRDEVQVAVSDTGIGIAPEDQARIFEEFQQASHSTMRTAEGTGLGLTLARRFVELHGGRISLESEPGSGSTFTISLPVRQRGIDESGLRGSPDPAHV